MVTGTNSAVRLPISPYSMAAIVAGVNFPDPETDFAAAWVAVWQACGGSLIIDDTGRRMLACPYVDRVDASAISNATARLVLRNGDEVAGALKALAALLELAGPAALDAVFALADRGVGA